MTAPGTRQILFCIGFNRIDRGVKKNVGHCYPERFPVISSISTLKTMVIFTLASGY